jgi:hypothetical protein
MLSTSSTEAVEAFFEAHRSHDIERMVDLCDAMAGFRYVPLEVWGKQRVVRGDGRVNPVGKILWTGMIESFPDLTNELIKILPSSDGHVAAEVMMSGTQAKDWGAIGCQGRSFQLPHLFVFHVNDRMKIDNITSYWDGASLSAQLGHVEID